MFRIKKMPGSLRAVFAGSLLMAAFLLAGCSSPYGDPEPEMATVTINLGGGAARTGFCGTIPPTAISYEIWLINADILGDVGKKLTADTSGKASASVEPGNYSIKVEATIRGWDYAEAVYPPLNPSFEVKAGEPYEAKITMQRIPNAIVLDIQREAVMRHDFGPFTASGSPTRTITVSNYTGTTTGSTSATITAAITGGGFTVPPSITINPDESESLTITASATPLGRNNATLTISMGIDTIASINLSSIAATSTITHGGTGAGGLADLPLTAGEYHVLGDDITLPNDWVPIGPGSTASNLFLGTLDGNGHTINWGNHNQAYGQENFGLFGAIGAGGTVKNIGLTGSLNVSRSGGNLNVGALAGLNQGTIFNVASSVAVTAEGDANVYVGGIVGESRTNSSLLENSYSSANITATTTGASNAYAAGIANITNGAVNYTWTSGIVSVNGSGGIVSAGGISNHGLTPSRTAYSVALGSDVSATNTFTTTYQRRITGQMQTTGIVGTLLANFAINTMTPVVTGTLHSSPDGLDITPGNANDLEWWRSTPAGNRPAWTVHANKASANEASPWWWDGNRPRLWFE